MANASFAGARMSTLAVAAATVASIPVAPAASIEDLPVVVRLPQTPDTFSNMVSIPTPVRELTEADFTILTAADLRFLEAALTAPVDSLDYTELLIIDED